MSSISSNVSSCEGFRMPAHAEPLGSLDGPASESRRGRNARTRAGSRAPETAQRYEDFDCAFGVRMARNVARAVERVKRRRLIERLQCGHCGREPLNRETELRPVRRNWTSVGVASLKAATNPASNRRESACGLVHDVKHIPIGAPWLQDRGCHGRSGRRRRPRHWPRQRSSRRFTGASAISVVVMFISL